MMQLLMSVKELQRKLNHFAGIDPHLKIDGIFGRKTETAMHVLLGNNIRVSIWNDWPLNRKTVAAQQIIITKTGFECRPYDGWIGPTTLAALERFQNHLRDIPLGKEQEGPHNRWPVDNGANLDRFYGRPGTNHTLLTLPYPLRIAWDPDQELTAININEHCARSAERVLQNVLKHYGHERIVQLGLDLYSGCYNNRPKTGGSTKSVHAYAAALDFDHKHNQYRWGADRARFASSLYNEWWEFWEKEDWISLGRERNFDWMHVQAAQI